MTTIFTLHLVAMWINLRLLLKTLPDKMTAKHEQYPIS